MSKIISLDQYNKFVDELKKHVETYYVKNEVEIEDSEFDTLFYQVQEFEDANPTLIRKDSPTQEVMGRAEKNKVVRDKVMFSLGKCPDFESLEKWCSKFINKEFSIEAKLDGLACELIYSKGILIQAATRGDGKVGEDVTSAAKMIPSIPKEIDNKDERFETRGEIFLTKSGLEKINEISSKKYKNVRNAASGILRNDEPNEKFVEHLVFGAYMLVFNNFNTHIEAMQYLKSLNFKIVNELSDLFTLNSSSDFEEIKKYFEQLYKQREQLDFDIDGMVIKINDIKNQNALGESNKEPNWATAYKFPPASVISKIEEVEWLLGSKGNITPRARITPANIGGVTVTYITLHNIEELERLEAKINDYAVIERRGDVIPKITGVRKELRTGEENDIKIPKYCHVCGELVTSKKAFIRCDNVDCQGRLTGKIENLVNKLDIKDLGIGIIEKIVDADLVEDQTDIFKLTVDQLKNLDRLGEKNATKIVNNIKNAISSPLNLVISGLTIKNVGDNTGKILSKKYGTLDNFRNAKLDELVEINDIGEVTANNIISWIKENRDVINKLITYNVGMTVVEEKTGNLDGVTFAFTGSLSVSRKEFEKTIENSGGVISSIKKGLDYLIIGNGYVPAKAEKAEKYGAKVISEEDFYKMI